MKKICSKCRKEKKIEEYSIERNKTQKRCPICKSCMTEYHREWYHKKKNDPSFIAKKKKYDLISKQRIMKVIVEYLLNHPCVDCGEKDVIVLQFDHQRDKIDAVSNLFRNGKSIKKIMEEIEKCEVRCANCHTRKTAERKEWTLKGYVLGLLTQ